MKIRLTGLFAALVVLASIAHAEEYIAAPLPTEDEAIAVLQSDAGWEAKHMACRALRQIGTVKAVPALAALLGDEVLSHMACYALEPMHYPEAGAALREALPSIAGAARANVAIALGARADAQAVAPLAALLGDANPVVANAAAGALGRIATGEAVSALRDARAADTSIAIEEALLAAAQRQISRDGASAAVAICDDLLASGSAEHVRLGAFRLKAFAQPDRAPKQLIAALEGDDPAFRDMAGQIVAETQGMDATRTLARALDDLPAAAQPVLLRGLGDRGDGAARKTVLKSLDSGDPAIRLAAIKALGNLAQPDDVARLASFLDPAGATEAAAAAAALRRLPGAEYEAALDAAFAGAAPGVQAGILTVLTDRMAVETVPLAVANADSSDANVRTAALNALLQLAGPEEMPAIIASLTQASDDERGLAAKVLNTVASHHQDAVLPLVLDAEARTEGEVQRILLRALGHVGTPAALDAVVARLDDAGARAEAVKVLASWSTVDAAPELLALAKSEDEDVQDAAFEGYVRLARAASDTAKKEEMLVTAMDLATRKQQRWKVFSAWSTVATGKSMSTLLPYLDNPEVAREAATAVIEVARQIATHSEDAKNWAKECLKTVIDKTESDGIRGRAQAELDKIS